MKCVASTLVKKALDQRFDIKAGHDDYGYTIKVPYNVEAKKFIEELRYIGKKRGFLVVLRGSGSRSPHRRADGQDLRRYTHSIPLKYAEAVRIYIRFK